MYYCTAADKDGYSMIIVLDEDKNPTGYMVTLFQKGETEPFENLLYDENGNFISTYSDILG